MRDSEDNEIDVEATEAPLGDLLGGGDTEEETPDFDEVREEAIAALEQDETMFFGLVIAYEEEVEISEGQHEGESGTIRTIRHADDDRLSELEFRETLQFIHTVNDDFEEMKYPTETPGMGGLFGL